MRGKSSIRILSIVLILFYAQNSFAQQPFNYERAWKKVDTLVTLKGLTQSALAEVNKIYSIAKKEKNDAQVIKSLLYKMDLQEAREEDAQIKNIRELEKEIPASSQPARSILNSILANQYWFYLQNNRHRLYNRTRTENFRKEDIATWDIEDLHQKISSLFLESISNEKLLQQTGLQKFDPIIIKGNARYLRPTLFDLLAHRALDYFKNDERYLKKPAYAFEIDQLEAFADAKRFAGNRFITNDTFSLQHKALQLFQRLIEFHLPDQRPAALIDVDLERLLFVNSYGVMESKDSLFQKALQNLASNYPNAKETDEVWYQIALLHEARAAQYDPLKDSTHRFELLVAKDICERIIGRRDSSEGKSNCETLLRRILHKEINLETEKVNVPGLPFRTLVTYKNVQQVHFRILKMSRTTKESLAETWDENYWKSLVKLSAIKTFAQQLPATGDYQRHRVEINIDALPVGEYALLASTNKEFSYEAQPMSVQFFYVSDLSYISNGNDFFVFSRQEGQPLQDVDVQVWEWRYDYNKRKYGFTKRESLKTDKNGHVHVTSNKDNREASNLQLELTRNDDHLFIQEYSYDYPYRAPEDVEGVHRAFYFTDRSIYRPGQTVYFKGIIIANDPKTKKRIVAGLKTKIYLLDANGEQIDSLQLTTNEFGSYNGKFKLPENRLNGRFTIQEDTINGRAEFSVEEYKRPKFEVVFDKQKGSYKLNDTIIVKGNADAYAGNTVQNAIVKYRVVRKARFPYPWLFWKIGWPRSEDQEIAHGEAKTGPDGKFEIRFKAIPDKKVKKEFKPVFEYEIVADVTDISGETRTKETTISVSYQALQLSLTMPQTLAADSLKEILLRTTNMAGEFERAKIHVGIWRLDAPSRLIRPRYWEQPDQFIMSKEQYIALFPYDEYNDESKKETWKRLTKVLESSDSSQSNAKFRIPNSRFLPGWYAIEAFTIDKYGDSVKDLSYVQLTNTHTGEPATPDYNWLVNGAVQEKEPGEIANVAIGSSAQNVFIIMARKQPNQNQVYEYLRLSNQQKPVTIPVAEKDRGGIGLFFAFIKHNRFFGNQAYIGVPWTNKELKISYETYRDKTLPGSEEKWKIRLSGYKNEKIAAEVLTSMYDASLDEFKKQAWETPPIWLSYSGNAAFNGRINFTNVNSTNKYYYPPFTQYEKRYDRLADGFLRSIPMKDGRRNYRKVELEGALAGRVAGIDAANMSADYAQVPPQSKTQITSGEIFIRGNTTMPSDALIIVNGVVYRGQLGDLDPQDIISIEVLKGNKAVQLYGSQASNGVIMITTKSGGLKQPEQPVQIRKNFNETAFFFPDLRTDSSGNVEFSFTMPEALTRWKWMTLAHTKDLAFGYSEKTIITQKELMLQPNLPRFLREGDVMEISTKIVNLSNSEVTGQVQLELIDATTNQSVDGWFQNIYGNQYFTAPAKQSVAAQFSVQIPFLYNKPVIIRLVARTGNLSDGEENVLPVLTNKVLVTETLPLNVKGSGTKEFKFEKLSKSEGSETLQHHAVTVEFTSNPAWYAVQALPYLMEFPYECAEQIWNRFYSNALAAKIVNASPRIKQIFEKWKTTDTAALMSNLQKNEELKSVLLQETPWVMQAKSESEQKKRIALLFDLVRMSNELQKNLDQLMQMQSANGGFVWFKGGPDDRYITQYIITGVGHLQILDAIPASLRNKIDQLVASGIKYLDSRISEDYDRLKKSKADLNKQQISYSAIQYLYARSFFNKQSVPGNTFQAYHYYRKQSQQFWLQQNRYMQGMIALALFRTGDGKTSFDILRSLKENAIMSEELGMYWKDIRAGYYWHQAPIETQALLIEAFATIYKDNKIVDDLKTWLLKNKQTNNWSTTKATAEACYALLLQGTDWLANAPVVQIKLGDKTVSSTEQAEAGTGYFKKTYDAPFVNPSMGNISVSVNQPQNNSSRTSTTWGAVYWQYFENAENITSSATPLSLVKKVFVERNTDRGPVIEPIGDNANLKVGDKVKIRIELRVDREMEYVHMKDMRAAAFEPVNVISSYKWQGGLGYYESTKDASTNFFFNYLPKGTHVFEYTLFATQAGTFSNGITTIQCMYAPEFGAHSEGIRVSIEGQ
jgi:TonB-dependent SusC/RagA subfamily outer membrane receptor